MFVFVFFSPPEKLLSQELNTSIYNISIFHFLLKHLLFVQENPVFQSDHPVLVYPALLMVLDLLGHLWHLETQHLIFCIFVPFPISEMNFADLWRRGI